MIFRLQKPLAEFCNKAIKINGIKELAYLHPNYYEPDESILEDIGLSHGDRYSILRFNGLDAFHDMGVGGFTREDKVKLVTELEKHGEVFISSEAGVPMEIADRVIKIPKNRIHDALFYASLLVTDTQTMATEAAILGTPTVRCNSFVGPNDMGNFIELEERYNLLCNFIHSKDAIAKAVELISDYESKTEWGRRKEALLNDKVDVSAVMTAYIENYPDSFEKVAHSNWSNSYH